MAQQITLTAAEKRELEKLSKDYADLRAMELEAMQYRATLYERAEALVDAEVPVVVVAEAFGFDRRRLYQILEKRREKR